jgi:hypothetical protein
MQSLTQEIYEKLEKEKKGFVWDLFADFVSVLCLVYGSETAIGVTTVTAIGISAIRVLIYIRLLACIFGVVMSTISAFSASSASSARSTISAYCNLCHVNFLLWLLWVATRIAVSCKCLVWYGNCHYT